MGFNTGHGDVVDSKSSNSATIYIFFDPIILQQLYPAAIVLKNKYQYQLYFVQFTLVCTHVHY